MGGTAQEPHHNNERFTIQKIPGAFFGSSAKKPGFPLQFLKPAQRA
jgi:hypothetical protein